MSEHSRIETDVRDKNKHKKTQYPVNYLSSKSRCRATQMTVIWAWEEEEHDFNKITVHIREWTCSFRLFLSNLLEIFWLMQQIPLIISA